MMTDTNENALLDSASIQQCEKLAGNADLQGKRARALLEINNGESNSVAAEKSGLTAGQLSYLLGRFKKIGMDLFNAKVVKKAAVKKAVTNKGAPKKVTQTTSKTDVTGIKPTPVVEEPVIADDADKQLTSEPTTAADKKKKKKKKVKKSSKKDKAKKDSNKTKKDKKGKKTKKGKKKKSKKNKK